MLAISVDARDDSKSFAAPLGLSFPLLSDEDRRTISAYDVVDVTTNIALPATFVLDGEGIVRWKYIGEGKADRPSTQTVLDEVRKVLR